MARRPSIERVYQLDIRLIGIEPPIWRRITVSDQISLASLHLLVQVVMGWEHSHLHQFIVEKTWYFNWNSDFAGRFGTGLALRRLWLLLSAYYEFSIFAGSNADKHSYYAIDRCE